MTLSILLSIIFFTLGIIHFNWSAGGKFGFAASLPTNENGERMLTPNRFDCAMVGFGLILFAMFYLIKSGLITFNLPEWTIRYGSWIIPIIFILRAIGEFKYVGFFKQIKQTEFGKMDTKFFSPLCLGIGIIGVLIELIK